MDAPFLAGQNQNRCNNASLALSVRFWFITFLFVIHLIQVPASL